MKTLQSLFSSQELELLSQAVVPRHIAIIPDGNRRWAQKQVVSTEEGHTEGAEALITTIKAARELGVKVLTVFCFSTENWLRKESEVESLMQLFERYLVKTLPDMIQNGIRLSWIGRLDNLPHSLIQTLAEVKEATHAGTSLELVLAINYGGRDELCRTINTIAQDLEKSVIKRPLTEELIASYLDTARYPDPDLIIRTSGEKRLSNFLLWQSSYAEIYIEEAPWPEFGPHHLLKAILAFGQRKRRYGGGIY